jgi:FixJ family two-component response regulator
MMPNIDGLEVVLALCDTYPDIPVIAISGGMSSRSMDFLPVELIHLLATIQEMLGD